jgi:hypothetical protein
MKRLRREGDPIGWFLHQVWDRVLDRALWCSQEAVRNVRDEADVVLYVVNATEDPRASAYLQHELELLSWMGRPVLVVLNQVGTDGAGGSVGEWRTHLASSEVVRDVLSLDAFSRAWVEESLVLERVVGLLEGGKRAAMARLVRAWNDRNLRVFEQSVEAVARYLAEVAADREPIGSRSGPAGSWMLGRVQDLRALSRVDRERAMGALFDRVQGSTRRLMDRLIELHQLSGTSKARIERSLEDLALQGHEAINPTTGAIAGGLVSGLLGGLGADVLSGGLTFGGGAVLGALLGALGGYAFGGAFRLAAGREPAVQWQPAALDRLAREALLRYLVVAHHGRGRGSYTDLEYPAHWTSAVDAELAAHRDALHAAWPEAGREADGAEAAADRLRPVLRDALRQVLRQRFPGAAFLSEGPSGRASPAERGTGPHGRAGAG